VVTAWKVLGLTVAFAMGLAGTASAAVYGGDTTQRTPFSITLTTSGQVKSIGTMWRARCQSGKTFDFGGMLTATSKAPSVIVPGDNPLLARVKGGKLSGRALGSANFGDLGSGAITQKVSGRLKPTKATGTFSAHMDVLDAEAKTIDSCGTGTFRWAAERGPNVYAGSTTQGDPVVVIARKNRSKLDLFGFGWQAGCTPDGFWHIGEEFGNFPLTTNGAFGDTFTNDYPFSDNSGKNSFTYKIDGSLKTKRGSGTLSVTVAATDSAGATTQTCDSTLVRWSVTQ
jgi:hypothetical protein